MGDRSDEELLSTPMESTASGNGNGLEIIRNYTQFQLQQQALRKGKALNLDDRIKSPDDFLRKAAPKKGGIEEISVSSEQRPLDPLDLTEAKRELEKMQLNHRAEEPMRAEEVTLREQFEALKIRYERKMAQWTEYAQNVKHWQEQMIEIVQTFKKELQSTEQQKQEIADLKHTIQERDEELARLKASQQPAPHHEGSPLTSWIKNLRA